MTAEELEKVNQEIEPTLLESKKGVKTYAEVNQRVKAFRKLCPMGSIITEMVSNTDGVCIFRASVYADENTLLATGTAYEKEGTTFINKTSYIENCETSAVGRALGMCGIGIATSIASSEEVAGAEQQNAEQDVPITSEEMGKLKLELLRTGVAEDVIAKNYSVESINNLTHTQFTNCMKRLAKTADRTDVSKN